MSKIQTSIGVSIPSNLIGNYFRHLVNQFFKILPMRENKEDTLGTYMRSLQMELIGCKELIPEIQENSLYLTLLAILQYLINHIKDEDLSNTEVKREVFRAISICNKLKSVYYEVEVVE